MDGEKVDMTTEGAQITNSTSVMLTTVAGDEYAIGYVSPVSYTHLDVYKRQDLAGPYKIDAGESDGASCMFGSNLRILQSV